jgi:hypothetical protein
MTDRGLVPMPATVPEVVPVLNRLEALAAQQLAVLTEVSAKLDVLIAHSDEQVGVNRSMAHFTQQLTGQATVDVPIGRPGFANYRENAEGEGWEVELQYPNQPADWYPATAQEVQQIAERNASRPTRATKKR